MAYFLQHMSGLHNKIESTCVGAHGDDRMCKFRKIPGNATGRRNSGTSLPNNTRHRSIRQPCVHRYVHASRQVPLFWSNCVRITPQCRLIVTAACCQIQSVIAVACHNESLISQQPGHQGVVWKRCPRVPTTCRVTRDGKIATGLHTSRGLSEFAHSDIAVSTDALALDFVDWFSAYSI